MNKIHRALLATTTTALVAFSALLPMAAQAAPVSFDVAGIQSLGSQGDSGNAVFNINVGAGAHITGFAYNVNITAYAPSWLSELAVQISDALVNVGLTAQPGEGNDVSGTGTYAASIDLLALGLDFNVASDGLLRVEFFDTFFDNAFAGADGIWNSGTLTFTVADVAAVPEPAGYALMGLALFALGATRVRRGRTAGLTARPAPAC